MEEMMDLQVIKKRRRRWQEKFDSVASGVYVEDRHVLFKEQMLFNGCLTLYLPIDFTLSEDASETAVYKECGGGEFSAAVDREFPGDTLASALQARWEQRAAELPEAVFYEMCFWGAPQIPEGMQLGWFDYKVCDDRDEEFYVLCFTARFSETAVAGRFLLPFHSAFAWQRAIQLSLFSMKAAGERA